MKKLLKLQILSVLTLLIPINIFVIGDYLGAGIQFPLLKYQITYMGSIIISVFRDINYVINGTLSSKTAFSVVIWFIGTIILVIGIILLWTKARDNIKNLKISGILLILSAIIFLVSTILQYGYLLNGPAGVAIPIGLPVLVVIGVWIYHEGCNDSDKDEELG
jgi:hypothetical protein